MRTIAMCAALACIAACEPSERDQALDPQAGVRRLEVSGISGAVHVTADPSVDDVTVTAALTGSEARFVETRDGDVIRVAGNCPRHLWDTTCIVDYTVVLPPRVELAIDTVEGTVDVLYEQAPRQVEIRSQEGDVSLVIPTGGYALAIETGDGELRLDGVHADAAGGRIEITAGTGDVSVQGG